MRLALDAELRGQDRQCVAVELREQKQGRLKRVEPLVLERRKTSPAGASRQMLAVEAHVVPHEHGITGKLAQGSEGLGESRGIVYVVVRDTHQPGDEEGDRHSGIDEGHEAFPDLEVGPETHGSDVDDAVLLWIEARGLRVENAELRKCRGHALRIAERRRRAAAGRAGRR